ncbi:MAG: energy transducer TonB [Ferruginibacter sp.]|nr:energy transducer TonB [Ferruginibacter sp.]
MNSELIMKSDLLDILFEKRNKAYGAYTLRKFYNNRLVKSVCLMIVTVVVFSAFTFLPEGKPIEIIVVDPGFGSILPVPKVPEIKPKLPKVVPAKLVASVKILSTIRIVNNIDSADVLHDLRNRAIGSSTNILPDDGVPREIIGTGTGGAAVAEEGKVAETVIPDTAPLETAEIMPAYPGGMAALRAFLMRHLSNPRELGEGELISVKVRFVVGYDGKLQRFELVQDGGNEFNNEVIRVLKKMPTWIPGKSNGHNVSVYYTIPVKFIAED